MGLLYIEEEKRRRIWLIVLLLILLFGWLGFRAYTYFYLEGGLDAWTEYMGEATRQPVPEPCEPSYTATWVIGGRIAPISEQSWELKQEICIAGCFDRFSVTSTRVGVNETGEAYCMCDMRDCDPKPLPYWY